MSRRLLSYEVLDDEMGMGITVAATWGVNGFENRQVQAISGDFAVVTCPVTTEETEYLRFNNAEEARATLEYYDRLTSGE